MSNPMHAFDWIVVPPQSLSLRRVDSLVSGVLMAVVVGRLYGRPIEPNILRNLSNFVINRYGDDVVNESIN